LKVLLGYEWETGEPVYMPLHHLVITGLTQKSGKTTTLEALIHRSGFRAVAFKTKRGEAGFTDYREVQPYYRPRADWQYVESLVNVALGEKVKYEPGMRGAIMKVSAGSKDLREVLRKSEKLRDEARREFARDLYTKLAEYLKLVVPEIERWRFADKVTLENGVNVMDLVGMRRETQSLVIAAVIDYVADHLEETIIIVPEAWEHLPQGRMTPVKYVAENFIRKGAAIKNYLWMDSQDVAGIDKTPLRSCDNWILGRQKDEREVDRTLGEIPLPRRQKPPPEEIQTLPLGVFYACLGDTVKKTYVLPLWVPEEVGVKVARGKISPDEVREKYFQPKKEVDEDLVWKQRYEEEVPKLQARISQLEAELAQTSTIAPKELEEATRRLNTALTEANTQIAKLEAKLDRYEAFERALKELLPSPGTATSEPVKAISVQGEETTVTVQKPAQRTVEFRAETNQGKIMTLIAIEREGKPTSEADLEALAREHGWALNHNNMAPELAKLVRQGVLVKENSRPITYRLPRKVTVKVRED